MASKYDWDTAKRLFVEGVAAQDENGVPTYLNLREVSEQCGIPYQQVRERSGRERWREEQSKAMVALATKRRKARVTKMAGEAIKFDDQTLNVAKMGMSLIQMRLVEIGQHVQAKKTSRETALARMQNGELVEWTETMSAINYKEIQGLAIAASAFNEIGQKAMGTDAINVNVSGGLGVELEGDVSVSVREEMTRPDPDRIANILSILQRVNIDPARVLGLTSTDDENVIESTAEETDDGLQELPDEEEEMA